ncbi:hypothetical protein C7M84_008275 [Penaeus vannamei]|uniref:Mitochondrial import receptor subunit TOM22 homolog n=1 Tax=Penaeus vannamei TaxID=6689 RepID=A0A423TA23_PENVA|nr:hypothetical protein C7M84_008275 [Penaeus vannamei]
MFPERLRTGSANAVSSSVRLVKGAYDLSRQVVWIAVSTSILLFAPVMFEIERLNVEEMMKQDRNRSRPGRNHPDSVALPSPDLIKTSGGCLPVCIRVCQHACVRPSSFRPMLDVPPPPPVCIHVPRPMGDFPSMCIRPFCIRYPPPYPSSSPPNSCLIPYVIQFFFDLHLPPPIPLSFYPSFLPSHCPSLYPAFLPTPSVHHSLSIYLSPLLSFSSSLLPLLSSPSPSSSSVPLLLLQSPPLLSHSPSSPSFPLPSHSPPPPPPFPSLPSHSPPSFPTASLSPSSPPPSPPRHTPRTESACTVSCPDSRCPRLASRQCPQPLQSAPECPPRRPSLRPSRAHAEGGWRGAGGGKGGHFTPTPARDDDTGVSPPPSPPGGAAGAPVLPLPSSESRV